jgi:hypothetical protein
MTATFYDWRRNLGLAGGSLWLITASIAFVAWSLLAARSALAICLLAAMSVAAAALIFFGIKMMRVVLQLPHMTDAQPSEGRRIRHQFATIVAAEFAGFAIVNLICGMTHHWKFIEPLALIVVGLHFLPLARLFKVPRYNVMGVLFCAIPILTMLFIPRTMQVGYALSWYVIPPVGCALVCFVTAWAGLNEVQRFVHESRSQLEVRS